MTRQAVFRLKNVLPNLHVFKNLHTLFKNNGLRHKNSTDRKEKTLTINLEGQKG